MLAVIPEKNKISRKFSFIGRQVTHLKFATKKTWMHANCVCLSYSSIWIYTKMRWTLQNIVAVPVKLWLELKLNFHVWYHLAPCVAFSDNYLDQLRQIPDRYVPVKTYYWLLLTICQFYVDMIYGLIWLLVFLKLNETIGFKSCFL